MDFFWLLLDSWATSTPLSIQQIWRAKQTETATGWPPRWSPNNLVLLLSITFHRQILEGGHILSAFGSSLPALFWEHSQPGAGRIQRNPWLWGRLHFRGRKDFPMVSSCRQWSAKAFLEAHTAAGVPRILSLLVQLDTERLRQSTGPGVRYLVSKTTADHLVTLSKSVSLCNGVNSTHPAFFTGLAPGSNETAGMEHSL